MSQTQTQVELPERLAQILEPERTVSRGLHRVEAPVGEQGREAGAGGGIRGCPALPGTPGPGVPWLVEPY